MDLFNIFRRPEQIERSPAEQAEAEQLFEARPCGTPPWRSREPLPRSILFASCDRQVGHEGPHVFEALAALDHAVPRPDAETTAARRNLVWRIADRLHAQESAHEAWGRLGLGARLKLASSILELGYRVRGEDGGLPMRVKTP